MKEVRTRRIPLLYPCDMEINAIEGDSNGYIIEDIKTQVVMPLRFRTPENPVGITPDALLAVIDDFLLKRVKVEGCREYDKALDLLEALRETLDARTRRLM